MVVKFAEFLPGCRYQQELKSHRALELLRGYGL